MNKKILTTPIKDEDLEDLRVGDVVYLTRLNWDIDRVERDHPELKLGATKEMMV